MPFITKNNIYIIDLNYMCDNILFSMLCATCLLIFFKMNEIIINEFNEDMNKCTSGGKEPSKFERLKKFLKDNYKLIICVSLAITILVIYNTSSGDVTFKSQGERLLETSCTIDELLEEINVLEKTNMGYRFYIQFPSRTSIAELKKSIINNEILIDKMYDKIKRLESVGHRNNSNN